MLYFPSCSILSFTYNSSRLFQMYSKITHEESIICHCFSSVKITWSRTGFQARSRSYSFSVSWFDDYIRILSSTGHYLTIGFTWEDLSDAIGLRFFRQLVKFDVSNLICEYIFLLYWHINYVERSLLLYMWSLLTSLFILF